MRDPGHRCVIHSKGKQVVRPDPLSKEAKRMIGQISTLRNLIGALFVGCLNNHGIGLGDVRYDKRKFHYVELPD